MIGFTHGKRCKYNYFTRVKEIGRLYNSWRRYQCRKSKTNLLLVFRNGITYVAYEDSLGGFVPRENVSMLSPLWRLQRYGKQISANDKGSRIGCS